jgi:hypothetical protein
MSNHDSDPEQRRDKLLLRLLKTPPLARAETSERVRRAKGKKLTRFRGARASARKTKSKRN